MPNPVAEKGRRFKLLVCKENEKKVRRELTVRPRVCKISASGRFALCYCDASVQGQGPRL